MHNNNYNNNLSYIVKVSYRVSAGFNKLNLRLFKTFLIQHRIQFIISFLIIRAKVFRETSWDDMA